MINNRFSQRSKLTSKIRDEYEDVRTLPEALIRQQKEAQQKAKQKKTAPKIEDVPDEEERRSTVQKLIDTLPEKSVEYVISSLLCDYKLLICITVIKQNKALLHCVQRMIYPIFSQTVQQLQGHWCDVHAQRLFGQSGMRRGSLCVSSVDIWVGFALSRWNQETNGSQQVLVTVPLR